ncbi:hypothetical protein TMPK1_35320 [Rhodospirillales bacterium TMPK1]|uniref:Uncharacterized protein n=1 Tax=Roseiterribacter gracilis TaxID=2812848 RepID=A0A8S8XJD3_9PROT|nr:hypothetical protein TMPK1_35320 [Rhodospirillales bacterium TMPK1]
MNCAPDQLRSGTIDKARRGHIRLGKQKRARDQVRVGSPDAARNAACRDKATQQGSSIEFVHGASWPRTLPDSWPAAQSCANKKGASREGRALLSPQAAL